MSQLGVRAFFEVKSGKVPLAEALRQKREREADEQDRHDATRKKKAKEQAHKGKPSFVAQQRKIICAQFLKKDEEGRLILPPGSLYIGSAYKLNEGLGWADASPYAIPRDLRSKERPFGTTSKTEHEADRAKTKAEFRLRLERDHKGLERLARALHEKKLVCWCRSDEACHGPMLLELADAERNRQEDADKFGAVRIPAYSSSSNTRRR